MKETIAQQASSLVKKVVQKFRENNLTYGANIGGLGGNIRGPYGKLVGDIAKKFPIKNPVWHYDEETNVYTAEISSLEHGKDLERMRDPWNRPLPPQTKWEPNYVGAEEDQEIGDWTVLTIVAGVHVELGILND